MNDVPWLDLPQIGNVVDWLTWEQLTWFRDGCLIVNGRDPYDVLYSLFNEPMALTAEDGGTLWTCYGYQVPGDYDRNETLRYFTGSHRHTKYGTVAEHQIQPGDLIVCHRQLTYNPGPVRAYECMFTRDTGDYGQLPSRNIESVNS